MLATIRSALAASWAPAAVARACTLATTTWGMSVMAVMAEVQRVNSSCSSASPMTAISARSCPEENTGPLAASTTPATSPSAPVARRASSNSASSSDDRQLRRSGRLSVIVT